MNQAVCITSGGLDSTVLAYYYAGEFDVTMVAFNYGQRHAKELEFAQATAERLGAQFYVIGLPDLADLLGAFSTSSLVADTEVPDGHYAEESMKQTVVPNRNMVMLAIAGSVAVALGADILATGVHAGDHFIYPDCRPEFINSIGQALVLGNSGFGSERFHLEAPFATYTKADIVRQGAEMSVPFEKTWSCYKGGAIHCGRCGTCVERIEAFHLAGVEDPTEYEDSKFALEVTK